MFTEKDIDEIFEGLKGSEWLSIEQACEELGLEETYELLQACDNVFFYCSRCGWYCEISEMGEDTVDGELQCDSCEENNA